MIIISIFFQGHRSQSFRTCKAANIALTYSNIPFPQQNPLKPCLQLHQMFCSPTITAPLIATPDLHKNVQTIWIWGIPKAIGQFKRLAFSPLPCHFTVQKGAINPRGPGCQMNVQSLNEGIGGVCVRGCFYPYESSSITRKRASIIKRSRSAIDILSKVVR